MKKQINDRKGISLIVLAITIVVMIIIASAVILSFTGGDILSNAEKTGIRSELASLQEEIKGKNMKKYMNRETVSIQKLSDLGIKNDKYEDITIIKDGKLVVLNAADDNIKEIAKENNILANGGDLDSLARGAYKLENTSKGEVFNYRIYGDSIDEYQLLEYIEATGTQYIDTGVIPKSTIAVEVEFSCTNLEQGIGFGWGSSASQEAFFGRCINNQRGFHSAVSPSYNIINTGIEADTTKHTFYLKSGEQKFDGIVYGNDAVGNTATSGQTIYLFKLHCEWEATGVSATEGYGKVYSCKIWDGSKLIRDFAPCVRKSDGVVGMYDKVNHKFYSNKGTGTFQKGSETEATADFTNKSVGDYDNSTGKYVIPIRAGGKNLFDISKIAECSWVKVEDNKMIVSKVDSGFVGHDSYPGFDIKLNETYTVSYKITGEATGRIYSFLLQSMWMGTTGFTVTTDGKWQQDDKQSLRIRQNHTTESINLNITGDNIVISDIQVEYGSKATKYEPFSETRYKIYLDEPLRKVGDVADYIDFSNQKVIRYIDNNYNVMEKPVEQSIDVPTISLIKGTTILSVETEVPPSRVVVDY